MVHPILVENGRVIDPHTGEDVVRDVFMEGGILAEVPENIPADIEVVDAGGLIVCPGFWDIHVHLREPGAEESETIATGTLAAARGGFTTVVAMPNTTPVIDTPEQVAYVMEVARAAGHARVWTTAAITRGRGGVILAPLAELADAGAVAFTDDGCTVPTVGLMREAMQEARRLDRPIMDHAQDSVLERQGVMHEGKASRTAGLPGIPSHAEVSIVQRDVDLARETGCAVHIQHLTAAESLPIISVAKESGARVTAEVTPHHLSLADVDIDPANADYKMNPPLRSPADREALRQGLIEGCIDVLATDHAPHAPDLKAKGFLNAPFGILGLETAAGVTYSQLVQPGYLSLSDWVSLWTTGPARIMAQPAPCLAPGNPADLVLFDLELIWTVDSNSLASRSRNTPFDGWSLTGKAVRTILAGRTTWQM